MTRSRPWEKKNKLQCTFCGGDVCHHENYRTHPSPAIEGLHSDWVAEDILATQRLSSRLIKRFELMSAFNREGIKAVFNLQLPGEHPYCGDGILESGFSYAPEELFEAGIAFYNQGWPDMKVPDMNHMINTVHLMMFAMQSGGKIAVHCHAGYGRTGVAIACLQIFRNGGLEPQEIIDKIRSHRSGCIQTKKQRAFVFSFHACTSYAVMHSNRSIYLNYPKTLKDHMSSQKVLLHGPEWKQNQHCPKVVNVLCRAIGEVGGSGEDLVSAVLWREEETRNEDVEVRVATCKKEVNIGVWSSIGKEKSLTVLMLLLLDWLDCALLDPPLYLNSTVLEITKSIEAVDSVTYSTALSYVIPQPKFALLQLIVEKVVTQIPAPCEGRAALAISRIGQSLQGLHRTMKGAKLDGESSCVRMLYCWSRKMIATRA